MEVVKQRKRKVFASAEIMRDIIEQVNDIEEGASSKKLEKIKTLDSEKRSRQRIKKATKRKRLDEIKKELKSADKKKRKPAAAIEHQEKVVAAIDASKKRVTFDSSV